MPDFRLEAPFQPTGDQPQAIDKLVDGLGRGLKKQVLLGVTGSGKSLAPSEPILIGREDDYGDVTWSLEPIGTVVDAELARDRPRYVDDTGTEVAFQHPSTRGAFAVTVDPRDHQTVIRPVTAFVRHKAPDRLFEVSTSDGRAITVTGDHNFVRLSADARLETVATRALQPGDRLPLPKRLLAPTRAQASLDVAHAVEHARLYVTGPEVLGGEVDFTARRYLARGQRAPMASIGHANVAVLERFGHTRIVARRGRNGLPASLDLTDFHLEFLGLFVAEGHVADRYATITPGPENDLLARKLLDGIGIPHFGSKLGERRIGSRVVTEVLRSQCGDVAARKRLPPIWPNLGDHNLGRLLAGYFEGDGWVEPGAVCAVTKSQQLASELAYALLRFGIVARLSRTWKRATGSTHAGDEYWHLAIRGAEDIRAFGQHIGFLSPRKKGQLDGILETVRGGNSDTLPPQAGPLIRQIRQSIGAYERQVAAAAGMNRAGLDMLENGARRLRRGRAASLLAVLEGLAAKGDLQNVEDYFSGVDALRRLLACRWATVVEVREKPSEALFVYDLSVEGSETFLAGFGGLVVHNSYTISQVIARHNRPTLVMAHNKTLAAQLYSEFREFFPDNAVEYFVSYFDYYQPEAYLPRSDTYIEKDSSRNDEIDKLRHAATRALFERRDTIIVASVSCIYGLGAPVDYGATVVRLRTGGRYRRDGVLRQLVDLQYQRNDAALSRARFRVRGDTLELQPAYDDFIVRVQFFGDEVEKVTEVDPLTGEVLAERNEVNVYPASHYVTPAEKMQAAIVDIEKEMEVRVEELRQKGMELEAERLRQRTTFDLEMMRELGFCSGIENYSRHLARREAGSRPWTLLDYFPPDWLLIVDESHMTIPQVVGMYKNDRTRKEILVEFGFRLPSALDNRPLTFEEFEDHLNQVVFMSATPGPYELQRAERIVEQLVRPTGIVDPEITVHPTEGQIDDLIDRIRDRVEKGERALVTTLTKKMAEDLADYLHEMGVKVSYLHSEVDTLERVQILRDLRLGVYDVVVGINLLREGIDLPEVTLVAILDADKEGFLRSAWALIQTTGRAARNVGGEVVMYADRITESMQVAIDETARRRVAQQKYNVEHGIVPQTIVKGIRDINDRLRAVAEASGAYAAGGRARALSEMSRDEIGKLVGQLEAEMRAAARELEFERAATLRDEIQQIRLRVLEEDASVTVARAAERAATKVDTRPTAKPSERAAAMRSGARRGRRTMAAGEAPGLDVTSVTVLPADEEPAAALDGQPGSDEGTASDWLPGIRDEHEGDDAGWMARWLDRPTWDRRVTPNVLKRTGERPARRGGRRR